MDGETYDELLTYGQLIRTSAQQQRDRKIAVTLWMVNISLVLYRVPISNSHERQNAVGISVRRRLMPVSSAKKRYPAVSVKSHRTTTQTMPLRERDVAVACAQLQSNGHNNASSSNYILN